MLVFIRIDHKLAELSTFRCNWSHMPHGPQCRKVKIEKPGRGITLESQNKAICTIHATWCLCYGSNLHKTCNRGSGRCVSSEWKWSPTSYFVWTEEALTSRANGHFSNQCPMHTRLDTFTDTWHCQQPTTSIASNKRRAKAQRLIGNEGLIANE